MALAVAVVPLLIDLSNLDDTYYAGMAGGTLAGLYGIAQYFGIELIVRDSVRVDWWRPFSTSGNPNFLGAYMVLIAPLAAAALLTVRRRTVAVLSLAALTVTVITALCTYSRAAWLGLAVAAAIFGVLGARRPPGVDARTVRYRLAGVGAVLVG